MSRPTNGMPVPTTVAMLSASADAVIALADLMGKLANRDPKQTAKIMEILCKGFSPEALAAIILLIKSKIIDGRAIVTAAHAALFQLCVNFAGSENTGTRAHLACADALRCVRMELDQNNELFDPIDPLQKALDVWVNAREAFANAVMSRPHLDCFVRPVYTVAMMVNPQNCFTQGDIEGTIPDSASPSDRAIVLAAVAYRRVAP